MTASDIEGNIIFNIMIKNTAANVSRMMIDAAHDLNTLKDREYE